jgi:hypothetical protein
MVGGEHSCFSSTFKIGSDVHGLGLAELADLE